MSELRDNPEVLYGAAIALLIVVLLTPAVGGMARILGVVDNPDARRLNRSPIPRLGGLAIFLGILVPSLAFLDLSGEMRGILLGAAVACVVGAIDDFRGLSPVVKLAGQVLAAAIPTAFGVWIDHFTLPFLGAVDVPPWIGVPLTIVWIVAVMNMVNFLDGMDGLASGVCAISGVTFAVIALSLGKVDAAVLSAIVAGACIGFLRHNFFPARIFMGDSGALVLGFTLASVSVAGLLKTASTVVLFLPLLVLAVPIIDTSFVVLKRLKYRQPISAADRSHLHHRFINIGFSQRRAALTMWAWTASLGIAALATRFIPFREGGVWHPWQTVLVVAIALVRARVLGLHHLPARDRQARQPAGAPARRRARGRGARAARSRRRGEASASPPGLRLRHELRQPLVERGMPLRRVPVARQHEALRVEPLHEHVADGIEGGEVRARDDELRKPGRGEGVEVDLRLPRAALDDQRARTLLELRRQRRRGVVVGADVGEEAAQECLGIVGRAVCHHSIPRGDELSTTGLPRATRIAGGSITVSECDRSGTAAAASSVITPP